MTKKDQTMLGIVGALVVGAGAVWYLTSGGGDAPQERKTTGTQQRRTREARVEKKVERKTRQRAARTTEAPERRQREAYDTRSGPKKKRGRRANTEKKKKIVPAA